MRAIALNLDVFPAQAGLEKKECCQAEAGKSRIKPRPCIGQAAFSLEPSGAHDHVGLRAGPLAETIETAYAGTKVTQVLENQRTYDVVVRYRDDTRADLDAIKNTVVDTPSGAKIAGNETGNELQAPMGVVILGGLISATALNMLVVPALYAWFARPRGAGP